jgi:dehydro coenzyme F420 reductase / coenzyme F420-0:L-glutamate ligase / coenzyme F420-1:gamma-L-glutamate ligase
VSGQLTVAAPDGVPEVEPGADLAGLLIAALEGVHELADGDIVAVTSKAVAKAEGRVTHQTYAEVVREESARVVARRGETVIARHRLGLTLAAAGVDASNVAVGAAVPLPVDPDASARRLRAELHRRTGRTVGVLVTDTAGRPWRTGQTDLAVGAAGVRVVDDLAGVDDGYGHLLAVTAPAVADELAAAAELAQTKTARRPFAVLSGRADLVLGPDDPGPGARALVRPESDDWFGHGAREAVTRALAGREEDRSGFGRPAQAPELLAALAEVPGVEVLHGDQTSEILARGHRGVLAALAFAHGWRCDSVNLPGPPTVLLRSPERDQQETPEPS